MDGVTDHLLKPEEAAISAAAPGRSDKPKAGRPVLGPWLRAQSVNVVRHAAALRPFRREEFGTGGAAPSEGHVQAVNALMASLRKGLIEKSAKVNQAIRVTSLVSLISPRRTSPLPM